MKATLTFAYDPNNDTVRKNRKEKNGFFRAMAIIERSRPAWHDHRTDSTIEARFYCPGTVVYCCLWVHGKEEGRQGGARAGGYGYHKPSAALAGAIRECGIELDQHIGGAGEGAMREAMCAIADAINLKNYILFETHP